MFILCLTAFLLLSVVIILCVSTLCLKSPTPINVVIVFGGIACMFIMGILLITIMEGPTYDDRLLEAEFSYHYGQLEEVYFVVGYKGHLYIIPPSQVGSRTTKLGSDLVDNEDLELRYVSREQAKEVYKAIIKEML